MSDLRFMAGMRPTAEIEADLLERKESGEASGGMIQMLEKHLERGRLRDAIQETRPEGCWCIGYGSRDSYTEIRYTSEGERRAYRGTMPHKEYCGCPEGQAVKAAAARERAEHVERLRRERWDRVGVPPRFSACSLENFPANERTETAYQAVKFWVSGPEIDETIDDGDAEYTAWRDKRNESLLLYGSFGTGKTGLGAGVLRELVEEHGAGMFLTVPNLLDRIRSSYGDKGDGDRELLDKVLETPVLMLDDIGAERVTEWVAEKLFTIINTRHDNLLPTIFTSNLDPKQLAGHVGERTAWRIIEMCEVIKLEGANLRDRRG